MANTTRLVLSYSAEDGESEEKVIEVAKKLNDLFDTYPHLKTDLTIEASAQLLLDKARQT